MKKILKLFKRAFSLTETIILLTLLAIAVASLTPMVTKKIVNNTEAGTTINGVAHGRYEIYSKEIVTYGSTSYEKTTKPTGGGVGFFGGGSSTEATILVFERLDDRVYFDYMHENPTMNDKGQKSTLYEQIEDAKVHRTPSGDIDYVEFKKQGVMKKYPVGGSIIVEGSDVVYKKGVLTVGNPSTFTETKGSGAVTLPNDTHRIIEGVLTTKIATKSHDGNNLWLIKAENSTESKDKFEGTVTVIPWEKVISGNNTIIDKPIAKNAAGEYVGNFNPGEGTKSLVIHAVGGGGAGGGLKDVGSAITPQTANDEEIKYMKQTLAKRFKEVAAAKGLPQANIHPDILVQETWDPNIHEAKYETQFGDESDTYILLNRKNGSITVKVDTRTGLIFPHELLDYTNILGSQTQESDLYNMPIWGDFSTLASGGDRGSPFYAGAVGCGCGGGKGTSYKINSGGVHFEEKRNIYCPTGHQREAVYGCCNEESYSCTSTDENGNTYPDTCTRCLVTPAWSLYERKCQCACNTNFYVKVFYYMRSCPGPAPECEAGWANNCTKPTSTACYHKMEAGKPGAAPACAVACTKVTGPIWAVETTCNAQGCPGLTRPQDVTVDIGKEVTVQMGGNGRTCYMNAGNHFASSTGGTGSHPCYMYTAKFTGTEGTSTGGASSVNKKTENKDVIVNEVKNAIVGEPFGPVLQASISGIVGDIAGSKEYANAFIDFVTSSTITSGVNILDTIPGKNLIKTSSTLFGNIFTETGTLPLSNALKSIYNTANTQFALINAGSTVANPITETVMKQALMTSINSAEIAINGAISSMGYNAIVEFAPDGTIGSITGPDAQLVATFFGQKGVEVGPVIPLTTYPADVRMAKLTPTCGSNTVCGANGINGQTNNDCPDTTGIDVSQSGHKKRFNHIYSWTMPYAMNRLAYGEAGQAGEYKTTKIAKTTGPLEIRLGVGGVWSDHKNTSGNWTKGKKGTDGTDTIVKMGGRNVLTAKGGKGGSQSLTTHRYDLCYAKEGTCSRDSSDVACCKDEVGKRSTKEILTTAGTMSAFENIKALTGNSLIIGIGLGRGGEGAGSRAQVEELKGLRVFRNSSGYGLGGADKILGPEGSNSLDVAEKFKNYALAPSALNFKGGDGAVIITW